MDIIRPTKSESAMDKFHLTTEKLYSILSGLPSDCKVLVQQIDEEYKESWESSKYYVVNADSSIVGEYWQAWSAHYNEEKNLLLIHLHY